MVRRLISASDQYIRLKEKPIRQHSCSILLLRSSPARPEAVASRATTWPGNGGTAHVLSPQAALCCFYAANPLAGHCNADELTAEEIQALKDRNWCVGRAQRDGYIAWL